MMLWAVSVASLTIVVVLCLLGSVTHHRRELSPLQWLGLVLTFLGALPRLWLLIETGSFDGSKMPELAAFSTHVGLACYAAGTAWRVVWYRRRREFSRC